MTYKGSWDGTSSYEQGDVVLYPDGRFYIALKPNSAPCGHYPQNRNSGVPHYCG